MSEARTIGSLFTGYGGLELGLERAGLGRTIWQAEIDPYCREIEARHWPDARRFNDVREVTADAADRVDVLCGGFPCQPFSGAGKQLGTADPRWLWPEIARIAEALSPAIIICENVPGLRTAGLRDVLVDLARLGFDAEWTHFRAWDLGAPHLRNRFWLVATHPDRVEQRDEPGWLGRACRQGAAVPRDDGADRVAADADGNERGRLLQEGQPEAADARGASSAPDSDALRRLESARLFAIQRGWSERCGWTLDPAPRVDDGPAPGLDRGGRERARKAAGNGVVVACAEEVGRAVMASCAYRDDARCAPAVCPNCGRDEDESDCNALGVCTEAA